MPEESVFFCGFENSRFLVSLEMTVGIVFQQATEFHLFWFWPALAIGAQLRAGRHDSIDLADTGPACWPPPKNGTCGVLSF